MVQDASDWTSGPPEGYATQVRHQMESPNASSLTPAHHGRIFDNKTEDVRMLGDDDMDCDSSEHEKQEVHIRLNSAIRDTSTTGSLRAKQEALPQIDFTIGSPQVITGRAATATSPAIMNLESSSFSGMAIQRQGTPPDRSYPFLAARCCSPILRCKGCEGSDPSFFTVMTMSFSR